MSNQEQTEEQASAWRAFRNRIMDPENIPQPVRKRTRDEIASIAVMYIQEEDLPGIKSLIPAHLGPRDLSGGAKGVRRPLLDIANFHAKITGNYDIVNYLNQVQKGGHMMNPFTGRMVRKNGQIGRSLQSAVGKN